MGRKKVQGSPSSRARLPLKARDCSNKQGIGADGAETAMMSPYRRRGFRASWKESTPSSHLLRHDLLFFLTNFVLYQTRGQAGEAALIGRFWALANLLALGFIYSLFLPGLDSPKTFVPLNR